ncbi:MAG: glycosyltransferase family 39 protein [Limisphaera sp.]
MKPVLWLTGAIALTWLSGWARALGWPLLPVDETRYLSVAWEMWLRGEVWVPHLNGAIYTDKPPLLFWLIHLGWAVGGVGDLWPRMLPVLAATGAVLLTARLARVLWPREAPAHAAVWILVTSGLWFLWSGLVMFDLVLTVFVLLGWNALVHPPRGQARWWWWALAVAGGVLTKGPVVLLFLLPPAALVRLWHPRASHADWHRRWLTATGVGLLPVLIWLMLAVRRAGWHYGLAVGFHQTAHRVVHSYAHRRPFWWYLPLLPLITMPWGLRLLLFCNAPWLRTAASDPGLRFLAAATLPAFVMLSAISGKQVHYLLPLFPALALALARHAHACESGWSRIWRWAWAGLFTFPLVAWLVGRWGPVPTIWLQWVSGLPAWSVVLPAALGTAMTMISRRHRNFRIETWACTAGVAMWIWTLGAGPSLKAHVQLDALAQEVRLLEQQGRPVAWMGHYQGQLHFLGRLERPLPVLGTEEVEEWIAAHPDGVVLVSLKHRPQADLPEGIRWFCVEPGGIALVPARSWGQIAPVVCPGLR